jgi:hypothetical protein
MEAHLVEPQLRKHVVNVIYNGVEKPLAYNPEALVKVLLEHAIKAFGITNGAHVLALFTTAGTELNDEQTAEQAGIKDEETLLLRPSTVKGGSSG